MLCFWSCCLLLPKGCLFLAPLKQRKEKFLSSVRTVARTKDGEIDGDKRGHSNGPKTKIDTVVFRPVMHAHKHL
ncbi:hypothetical protein IW261DRAFT_1438033 [Armillaria novae-zelandiae]|uniref:Secreted protein n=1 Tax=Armillaria novae-zelandiae TaxID=153914 RepID=A0AA39UP97_9AGAR|nr:hypothetical protein IW261DRAFT_1438033 [Armillaria novae-zelandiae]